MSDDSNVVSLKGTKIPVNREPSKLTLRRLLEETLENLEDEMGDAHVNTLMILGQTSAGGYHNVPVYGTTYDLLGMVEHHKHLILTHYLD